ncbi:xanthine dehydrogenase-like [Atheta coriaria]|uniref:xanthine dehydrogenase-like n=1 Tax=Dalotia coriaria TaxID=877792 RepID=UPI0031F44CCD
MKSSVLVFFVNGKKIVDDQVNPEWTLLQYLRNKLRLCGVKLGCGEGGCGACTVMVSKYQRETKKVVHFPVNACLAPVCSMHGLAVVTVEGIGSTKTKLHPVQERIAKAHGSQCGFCTPGIVMSMYTLLRNCNKPKMDDLDVTFQGNLCRCTGYRPIIEGYKTFTEDWELMQSKNKTNGYVANGSDCIMGANCCKYQQLTDNDQNHNLFNPNSFVPYDSSQEPIFPAELKLTDCYDKEYLMIKGKDVTWYRPDTLESLLQLKSQYPKSKIIVGNTEVGIEVKFKGQLYTMLIQPTSVHELNQIIINNDSIRIGAAVTLEDIKSCFENQLKLHPKCKTYILKSVVEMLHRFAGKQIRSVASIGGNIMTGSPISDLNPIWMAIGATLHLSSSSGTRSVIMDDHFFTGYRKTIVNPDEILESIEIPFTKEGQYVFAHKQSRRRDDDIAIVNTAINIIFQPGTKIIEELKIAFGGLGPTTFLGKSTQNLRGLEWNNEIFEIACTNIFKDTPLSANAPGGMVDYRRALALSFFFRTFLEMNKILNGNLDKNIESAVEKFHYKTPSSTQFFDIPINSNEDETEPSPVGKPLVHRSALKQATGEAIYTDDIPHIENELYMAFVYTTKAHAMIKSIDPKTALAHDGVIGFISAKDISEGRNKLGPVHQDEQLFITDLVSCQGQFLGAILAVDQTKAQRAAKLVKVEYEALQPCIVSIEDAILHGSLFPDVRRIEVGNVDETFKMSKNIIQGKTKTGYQEHFYFETIGCLVIPKETDEFEMFVSSQHHAEITDFVSRVLGIPQHKIVTRIKRIGGGFGGKQSRTVPIAMAAAVAAQKFNRPVRILLDRDEDMAVTGGRHPYLVKYKAAFSSDGTIDALDVEVFANAGHSYDLSLEVLERAVFHVENCYKIKNLRVVGRLCKTNLPSNTAFRGFGAPQAMFAAEYMIRQVAEHLKMDLVTVVAKNLYKEGDITHYSQQIINCNLSRCFEECLQKSNYFERQNQINQFNIENKYKKRGISIVTTKYGVGFGVPFLEQSGCLINVYTDGSILLTIGGVEMGQGLYTKMIQIAAKVLGVAPGLVHINECATDKVPNSSPSAASVGSDLNGMAVLRACEILKERLKPLRSKYPELSWEKLVNKAYFERISLSAVGHFATPDVFYDWETNSGTPYNYYTFGAACTEVEIDCLTGDHRVLRTDIIMDLGASLNPAIDIGQVEGAFMQGYGLFVLEEMLYSPEGTVMTRGPGAYKIPGFSDIPTEFNVSLLKGSSNPRAVYSSKAVGEPPLFLASSVLFAIREAIIAARKEQNIQESFQLDAPATAEKIRMFCVDNIIKKICETGYRKSTWNVIP